MIIAQFEAADVAPFLTLAGEEGWIAEQWECDFLRKVFPHGCFTARIETGEPVGYVTSVRHGMSGWIGNLIVSKRLRGTGVGTALFRSALGALRDGGAATIWLTASRAGAPLYEKYHFTTVDTIQRWVGMGTSSSDGEQSVTGCPESARSLDAEGWGDRRDTLLELAFSRGGSVAVDGGFIVRQPCGTAVQIGPFGAVDGASASALFDQVCQTIPAGTKLFVDAPAANRGATVLYRQYGMSIAGSNLLMYAGEKPDYCPELVYGLATMGSCG